MLKVIREFRKKRTRLVWFVLTPISHCASYSFFLFVLIAIIASFSLFFTDFLSYAVFKEFDIIHNYTFLSKEHISNNLTTSLKFLLLNIFFVMGSLSGNFRIGINSRGIYEAGRKGVLCKTTIIAFSWRNFKSIMVERPDLLFRNVRRVFFYFDKSKAKNVDFLTRYLYGKVRISVEEKDLSELLSEIKKYAPERLHPPEVLAHSKQ